MQDLGRSVLVADLARGMLQHQLDVVTLVVLEGKKFRQLPVKEIQNGRGKHASVRRHGEAQLPVTGDDEGALQVGKGSIIIGGSKTATCSTSLGDLFSASPAL